MVKNKAVVIPPTTTIASGFWACEPIEGRKRAGEQTQDRRQRGHGHGPQPQLGSRVTASPHTGPRGPHLVEE